MRGVSGAEMYLEVTARTVRLGTEWTVVSLGVDVLVHYVSLTVPLVCKRCVTKAASVTSITILYHSRFLKHRLYNSSFYTTLNWFQNLNDH